MIFNQIEELTNTISFMINDNEERKFKYEKLKESKEALKKRTKIIQVFLSNFLIIFN